jgi:hypothetical protein
MWRGDFRSEHIRFRLFRSAVPYEFVLGAVRLDIHEHTVTRWAKHDLIASHAYNGHYCLYEIR